MYLNAKSATMSLKLDKIKNFTIMPPPGEDYDCWLKALGDSVYVDTPLVYYDSLHGYGIQWDK